MFPLINMAMMLLSKEQKDKEARQAEQNKLRNERIKEMHGSTKMADATNASKARGQVNMGDAASLYGTFASDGADAGSEEAKNENTFGKGGAFDFDDANSRHDRQTLNRYGMTDNDPERKRKYGL